MDNVNYGEQVSGADEAGASYGMPEMEGLPSGWYPMVVKGAEIGTSRNTGVPLARVQLGIAPDGECLGLKGRTAFVDVYLGAGKTRVEYDGGKKSGEFVRTPEEFKEALNKAHETANGFLAAIGVSKGKPTAPPSELAYVAQYWNVENWKAGQAFMARIVNRKGYNNLAQFAPMDDAKNGIQWWASDKRGMAATQKAIASATTSVAPSNGKSGSVGAGTVSLG